MEYDLLNEDSATPVAATKEAPAVTRCGPGWPGAIIASLAISAVVSAITTVVYDHWYAQKVVAVDIKGYAARQGKDFIAGKITEEQFRQKFDHLQKVVEAIPPNKAVLMGDLVVRNVECVKP
jgi:hypothetical protein